MKILGARRGADRRPLSAGPWIYSPRAEQPSTKQRRGGTPVRERGKPRSPARRRRASPAMQSQHAALTGTSITRPPEHQCRGLLKGPCQKQAHADRPASWKVTPGPWSHDKSSWKSHGCTHRHSHRRATTSPARGDTGVESTRTLWVVMRLGPFQGGERDKGIITS